MKTNEFHDWREVAVCAQLGQEFFFPEDVEDIPEATARYKYLKEAKAMCAVCPVRQECLQMALDMEFNPTGIWGGTTQRKREKLRRGNRIKEAA